MADFTNEQVLAANNNTQSDMIQELSATIGQLHTQIAHDKSVIKSLSSYVQKLEQENIALKKDVEHLTTMQEPVEDPEEQNTPVPKEEKKPKVPRKQDGKNQGGDE